MNNEAHQVDPTLRELARSCACSHVRRASRVITQFYDSFLRGSDLQMTQFIVLVAIELAGQETVMRLAQKLVMDRSALAHSLKPLQDEGLLTVEPGTDRRTRVVRLTEKGRRKLAETLPAWKEAQRQFVERLGEDQNRLLLTDLKRVESLNL